MSNNLPNINISPTNVQGKCDLKCSYNFKYSESNSTAKNNGVMINLTYDNTSQSPVLYNSMKYNVDNISIMCPSIHTFNDTSAAAEIIIEHMPVNGGPKFMVAIPIIASTESSTASNLITDVIESVANNAPVQGETTNLNISGFTLQNIVPKKPYFSYTSPDKNDWIVFGIMDAIPLSSTLLTTLSQIIKPFPLPTPGNGLFYNSAGPNNASVGDGIYISCQPTGSSQDESEVTYDKNQPSYNLGSILSNPTVKVIFQILLGCLIFILIFTMLNYLYTLLTSDAPKLGFKIPKFS
jgi:carbonic anhydrase